MTSYLTPIAVTIGVAAWIYISWKLGIKTASNEATDNWKEAYESTKVVMDQMKCELNDKIGKLSVQVDALRKENSGLTRDVNTLKQVQVFPSKEFEKHIDKILEEMRSTNEMFISGLSKNSEEINKIWSIIDTTNTIAVKNNEMLKKLCKEV